MPYNIIMYFKPFVYFIPENLYYLLPTQDAMIQPENQEIQRKVSKKIEIEEAHRQKRIKVYLEIFREQIIKMQKSNSKKYWTEEEDNFLLNLNPSVIDWNQVSLSLPGTNVAICKRRHYRLKEQLIKWPKEVDTQISKLFQQQKLGWPEIRENINKKYCEILTMPKLSTNKIKERYMLYLRPGICKQEWTLQEDLQIIRIIKQHGKEWTKVLKSLPLLQNRTELQLKNRYFGTLKFLQKKVERKVSAILKSKKTN